MTHRHRLQARGLTLEVTGRTLFNDLSVDVAAGECLVVMGPSGAGKSSLLNCLAGIVAPTRGAVRVDGVDLCSLRSSARAAFRLRNIGLVFQFGELLPELTVVENVSLPLRLAGGTRASAERAASGWLERLGIADRAALRPDLLSGGEVQRAAIARALIHEPALVLADEPTGALDAANTALVADVLTSAARDEGAAVVLATHDPSVAAVGDDLLELRARAPAVSGR